MMRQSSEPYDRVGMGSRPHLFPDVTIMRSPIRIRLGAALPATDKSVDALYQLLGFRAARLPIWRGAENSPVHRVPRCLPHGVHAWLSACVGGLERGSVEDVVLGGLDPARGSKARIASIRITQPATIVGARSGCRPGISARLASGAEAKRESIALDRLQREDVAVDAAGVVGLELELDRGERGRRAGDGDARLGAGVAVAGAARRRSGRGRRWRAPRARRRSAGRRRCGARCGGRRRPAARRGSRPRAPLPTIDLGRAAADVDRPGSARGGALGGGAAVGEPRLLLAVEHAGREAKRSRSSATKAAPLEASRTALVAIAATVSAPRSLADRHVVADRPAGRLDRLVGELPGEVDAPARAASPGSAARARRPAPADVGDQQPRRVAADVDNRHSVGSSLPSRAGHSSQRPAPALLGLANRRGVEQPGSSSGS